MELTWKPRRSDRRAHPSDTRQLPGLFFGFPHKVVRVNWDHSVNKLWKIWSFMLVEDGAIVLVNDVKWEVNKMVERKISGWYIGWQWASSVALCPPIPSRNTDAWHHLTFPPGSVLQVAIPKPPEWVWETRAYLSSGIECDLPGYPFYGPTACDLWLAS